MPTQLLQYTFSWYSEKAVAKNIYNPKIKQINKDSNFNTDYFRITAVSEELVVYKDWRELITEDYCLIKGDDLLYILHKIFKKALEGDSHA